MNRNFQPIIGMEIHVELKTNSKMFCGCKNDPFHAPKPNCYTCPVCLGLPGALPVANKKAIEWTIMLGLALHCEIPPLSKFDRKNYFYPDLPKGYQISQYDQPLAVNGWLEIPISGHPERSEGSATPQHDRKRIRITRVHLEEDTGKLQHATINSKKVSLIDFNRSGVPLVEIVTEPDITSSEEARVFLKQLHQIVRYLSISDAEMEKGSMRLEPNISVAQAPIITEVKDPVTRTIQLDYSEFKLPPYKVEVKNINSFSFVKKAIDYEVERQSEILERGELLIQETRGWDEKKNRTAAQRRKEGAADYRYFPDPDLPPMVWTKDFIAKLKQKVPELPEVKLQRFMSEYKLPEMDAVRLVETVEMAQYFESAAKFPTVNVTPKTIANWIINKKIDIFKVSNQELLKTIAAAQTKTVIGPHELERIIDKVITDHAKAVADYKNGKTGVLMFLVGMTMKELKGKGVAQVIKQKLEEKLQ